MLIVPTDNYDPVFYASKCNNNTIDSRKSLIRILNEEKKPSLQIFTDILRQKWAQLTHFVYSTMATKFSQES